MTISQLQNDKDQLTASVSLAMFGHVRWILNGPKILYEKQNFLFMVISNLPQGKANLIQSVSYNRGYTHYIIQNWSIKVEGEQRIKFSYILYTKGWVANAAQAITRQQCNGRLYLIELCYTLGIRSCLSVRNLDNYKAIAH